MHYLLKSCLLLALPMFASAQSTDFIIQGEAPKDRSPKKLYLTYLKAGRSIVDSTDIINGAFVFKGNLFEPAESWLHYEKSTKGLSDLRSKADIKNFYLEPGITRITLHNSLNTAEIADSKLNIDFIKYNKLLDSLNLGIQNLRRAAATDMQERGTFPTKLKALEKGKINAYVDYIQHNPSSYFSLDALTYLLYTDFSPSQIESLYSGIAVNLQNSDKGMALKKNLKFEKLTAVGNPVMDFTQNDVNNKPVSTKDFRGKYLLIDFWASWCGPCRAESPHLVQAYEEYRDKGFEILGVSLDDLKQRDAWLKAIADDKLTWTQVSDLKGWKNEASVMYGVRGIPSNFLIGPDGKIIARNLRGMQVQEKLKEIFQK